MNKALNKLTDTGIKNASFEKSGKRTKLADGGGLYLDIQQSGTYWRLKYRYGGKEKLLALGVYPTVTLKQARKGREEAKRLLADGVDPVAHRFETKAAKAESSATTFKAVTQEWIEQFHKKSVGATT